MEQSLGRGCTMARASPAPRDPSELCGEHDESLTVFCLDDLQPLCQRCAEASHSQHRVYLLSEAAADCKGELNTSLHKLKHKKAAFENVTEDYQQVSKHNLLIAENAEEQIKKEFEELHRILQKEEADRLLSVRQDKEKRINELQEQSKLADEKVRSLEERIRLTEAELDAGGEGVEFLKNYPQTQKRQCTNSKKSKWNFLMNVAKHLANLKFLVWKKMKHSAPYTPVTLDPRTAGQGLTVPTPLNMLHCSADADEPRAPSHPDHPERFHPFSAVLAREGFSSGVYCWDIEVSDCDNWTVGVASESIPRRAYPESGLWCICLRDGEYLALTTPAQALPYNASRPLKRIHVRLDFNRSVLEFHNAESDTNIFTFKHNFTETVHPYFESASKTGSLCVVPREVGVCVALEGETVEDGTENENIDSSVALSKSKVKKTRKNVVKNNLVKSKPNINQTPGMILFSDEYHVSLFRSQTINIKHG